MWRKRPSATYASPWAWATTGNRVATPIGYTGAMRQRNEAALRGLRFIYRHARRATTSRIGAATTLVLPLCRVDLGRPELSAVAREFGGPGVAMAGGAERTARIGGCRRSGLLHVDARRVEPPWYRQPRSPRACPAGSLRFSARDYLGFDPVREAPSGGARSRYDIWCDALVLTYAGDGCGIPMGASYLDVLRWLPAMRPYRT